MMYQIVANELGLYQDENGKVYDILSCTQATGPDGINIGWQSYRSLKSALRGFGLKERNSFQEV